jgi:hypothetical protein
VRVIDALGGVDIELSQPIRVRMSPGTDDDQWRVYDFPAGRQHLDGAEALAYVRMRDPGDGPRMRRQRCLVASIVENADVATCCGASRPSRRRSRRTSRPTCPAPHCPIWSRSSRASSTIAWSASDSAHRPIVAPVTFPSSNGSARVRQVLDDPATALEEGRTTERAEELCS